MSSTTFSSNSIPPTSSTALALASSRVRRQRRDAVSRAAESDWEFPDHPPTTTTTTSSNTSSILPWCDEFVCPLAPSSAAADPDPSLQLPFLTWVNMDIPNNDDLQNMLARFAFPATPRKRRRSGDINVDSYSGTAATSRKSGPGPVQRASCAHCERGRSSA
ncbi:hypothetical protein B0F90DRAFT_170640 [Multifurca ochricompacta]|uniref:Uncharacterized protein n=1 Tax=Multifurca ochricompacta TaxID=376703 RepID=A0AAD4QLS6_9AGAM|nr:hypothetical protein B0F90DRAFT_170640 [Multifurca ochricompacta]